MTARFISTDPQSSSATPDLAAIRAAAVAARDAEIARMIRGTVRAMVSAVRWLFDTIAEWQQRNAAYQRLRSMSDRELADIGLTRDQIARVFEPDFRLAQVGAPVAPAPATPTPAESIPAPANDPVAAPARAA
jgi:uncharacterized protein YjiS (DUF1127 family)